MAGFTADSSVGLMLKHLQNGMCSLSTHQRHIFSTSKYFVIFVFSQLLCCLSADYAGYQVWESLQAPYGSRQIEVGTSRCAGLAPGVFSTVFDVTASSYRSLNALTGVEEPAGMGESLGTGAHRHRSILPPGVKYVPGPRELRRILSNRS